MGNAAKGGIFLAIVAVLCIVAYLIFQTLSGAPNPLDSVLDANLSHKSVTIGVNKVPTSLDVRTVDDDSVDQALLGNVYESLTSRDDNNKAAPGLAKSWNVSADARTYTFNLQSGAKFSNGDPLTSEDVVWSLQQSLQKKYVDSTDLQNLAGVSAQGDSTVRISLSSPNPSLLWALGGRAGIVYDKDASYTPADSALGSGPFTVSSFDAGKSLTLSRNDTYWGKKSQLAKITLQGFPSTGDALQALQKGSIQGTIGLDAAQVNQAKKDSALNVVTGDTTTRVVLVFNSDVTSIASDKRFRQALRMGLNRQQVIAASGQLGQELGGPIPRLDPGYQDLTGLFPTDVQKSLRTRAYFLTRNLTMVYPSTVSDAVASSIAQQYGAEGLQIQLVKLSPQDWKARVEQQRSFDLTIYTQTTSHDLGMWTSGKNWWTYDSPTIDDTYKDAMKSTNDADYQSKLASAAQMLSQDSPADWMYSEKVSAAWATGLSGMPTNMLNCHLPLAQLSSK